MSRAEFAGWPELSGSNPAARHDLRLLPGAVAVWVTTIAGLRWGWLGAASVAALALLVVLAVLRGRRGTAVLAGALAVAALAGATAIGVSVRTEAVQAHPLHAAAARATEATVQARIADLPHPLTGPGFAGRPGSGRVLVPADLVRARIVGRDIDGAGPILLLADSAGFARLDPGQQVTVSGTLAPPMNDPLTIAVVRVRGAPLAVTPAPWWERVAATLRADLRAIAAQGLDPGSAGLLPGLITGDTSGQPLRLTSDFQIAGLTHLCAVSGANIAMVVGAVLLLARLVRAGPRMTASFAGAALVGFVVVVGPQPSVLRAAVMGGIALLAIATGRRRSALPALAAAVLILLLADPALAVNVGFAMSVAATAALILIAPAWSRALRARGVPPGLAESIAIPTAAHAATAPLIVGFTGKLSLVAVPANMLAEPVVAPITVLGVLAMAVAPVWHGGAVVLVDLAGPLVRWLIVVARTAAGLPAAVISWPSGPIGALALTACGFVLAAGLRVRRTRALLVAAIIGIVLVWLPVRAVLPRWPVAGWAMVSCDVGQGDAEVLATADPGRAVVVDTGPDPLSADSCLRKLGVTRIPLVVLSHLHADHIGGLAAVLTGRTVGAVALGASRVPAWAYDQVRRESAAAHVPLVALTTGERLSWPGLALDVLATQPARDEADIGDPDGTTVNNTSVVLRAATSAGRLLLTGDVELAAQADLLTSGTDLSADVLKVPHHGSRYSVPAFLAAVRPRVAVVSVGAGNRYGHPSPLTIGELRSLGAGVARTDQDGDVAVLGGSGGPSVVRAGDPRAPPRR